MSLQLAIEDLTLRKRRLVELFNDLNVGKDKEDILNLIGSIGLALENLILLNEPKLDVNENPLPNTVEGLQNSVRAWQESWIHEGKSAEYYRSIVYKVGALFGEPAYTSDDGSIQNSVLAEKVFELVENLVKSKENGTN